ncbi:hypothetical protein ASG25_20950 [Rhizobium sp. Leaf384]|uniref:NrsF family protein n=1 Tax=unclassified Rhizobium TaxID=2613769 RepID=UPI00071413D0|nr:MULTISPECIES: DUF1109 domain-containing protein [unclassified Rhizobium]KQS75224.1 hypothetical protein ASG25_20950 [Rhizobium sp. Leaf384]KQS85549.1 hypothetical protein ASG58_19225 [Rhizobium sp. Leaf383]
MAGTNELIDDLVRDLRPVHRHALAWLLGRALLPGLALSTAFILFVHGLRPDLGAALFLPAFWVKSAYPLLLGLIGVGALLVVARPGGRPVGSALQVAIVYALLVGLAVLQLRQATTPDESHRLIMGISALYCPLIILATGAAPMAATFWFLRRSAPTAPGLAGAIAGLSGGALGAWIYSWGCIENGLPFVALWYTLGIVLCTTLGSIMGRLWLKW